MKVSNIKININRDAMNMLDRAKKLALYRTADAIKTDIATRGAVPKDVGELERSGFVDGSRIDYELIASIIYDTPYARRWYFNVENAKFKRETAVDHWMDYYLDGDGKQWVIDTYKKFFREEAGDLIK